MVFWLEGHGGWLWAVAGSIWARETEENMGAHVQVRRQLGRAPFGSLHESALRPSRGPGAASTDERLGRKTRLQRRA